MKKSKIILLIVLIICFSGLAYGIFWGINYVQNTMNKDTASRYRYEHEIEDSYIREILESNTYFINITKPKREQFQAQLDAHIQQLIDTFIAQSLNQNGLSTLRIDYQETKTDFEFYLDKRINGQSIQTTSRFSKSAPNPSNANQVIFDNAGYQSFIYQLNRIQAMNKLIIDQSQLQYIEDKPTIVTDKFVALTFNQSPNYYRDSVLLDVLNQYQAKATFFVLGEYIDSDGEILDELVNHQHQLGNLGYDFTSFDQLSCEEIQNQLTQTQEKLNNYVDYQMSLVRAPYGEANQETLQCVKAPFIQWSTDSLDWHYSNSTDIQQTVYKQVRPGSIILFSTRSSDLAETVQNILSKLQKDGYRFVTVSELFQLYGKHLITHEVVNDVWTR